MLRNNNSKAVVVLLAFIASPMLALAENAPKALTEDNSKEYVDKLEMWTKEEQLNQKAVNALKLRLELRQVQQDLESLGSGQNNPPMNGAQMSGVTTSKKRMSDTEYLNEMSIYSVSPLFNGKTSAEIRYGKGILPVEIGTELPGGWKIVSISSATIKVRKGASTEYIGGPKEEKAESTKPASPFPYLPQ